MSFDPALLALIDSHVARYPVMEAQDVYKLVYRRNRDRDSRDGVEHRTMLDKQFTAILHKSPNKGGWTYA